MILTDNSYWLFFFCPPAQSRYYIIIIIIIIIILNFMIAEAVSSSFCLLCHPMEQRIRGGCGDTL